MRKIFHQIHLWLGLVSGLLVFIIAITGALSAFKEEINQLNNYQYVEKQIKSFMLPTQLGEIAEKQLLGKELHALKYNGKSRAAEAIFYSKNPSYNYIVYLNPYNGQVQKVKDLNKDFFRFVMQGHFYLWLPPQIGHPLVASATLVFALVLLTGLVIWIPKNRQALKNRVWFRWPEGVKWPRINFDLHVVGGLYVTVFALIFALTGLVWGFQWFAQSYYKLMGGEKSLTRSDLSPYKQIPDSTQHAEKPLDRVWILMENQYPTAASIEVRPPHTDSTLITANATQPDGKRWKTDYRYFDQHSLKEVNMKNIYGRYADAIFADKLYRMNFEIHTGGILGLPGKIFAFLMSLCIASFPVTGFIIWWKKKRKK